MRGFARDRFGDAKRKLTAADAMKELGMNQETASPEDKVVAENYLEFMKDIYDEQMTRAMAEVDLNINFRLKEVGL